MKIQSLGSRWNVLEAIVQHLGCCNICAQRSRGERRERPPIGTRALGRRQHLNILTLITQPIIHRFKWLHVSTFERLRKIHGRNFSQSTSGYI
jgi:hypothetical protein